MANHKPIIETSNKPWHGQLEQAQGFLQSRTNLLYSKRAWIEIASLLGEEEKAVQRIKFTEFIDRNSGFRYTIALIWAESNSFVQNGLYTNAAEIVALTGWYPIPQGPIIHHWPRMETSTAPWFGPQSRAKKYLKSRTKLLDPKSAWIEFAKLLGEHANAVQEIRFIEYKHEKNSIEYTIALVWTYPNYQLREKLYSIAEDAVAATGWYPLPQGQKINSRLEKSVNWSWSANTAKLANFDMHGKMRTISSAVSSTGGCSIRLELDTDTILLDTGLPGHLQILPTDKAVLISHLHLDHFGGVADGSTENLPIVLSPDTAFWLSTQGRIPNDLSNTHFCTLSPEDDWQNIGDKLQLKSFRVPHIPGSVGYIICDQDSALIFTGDMVLKTARHNFLPQIKRLIADLNAKQITLLIDATMAARHAGASGIDAAKSLLSAASTTKDIVITSKNVEQLLYAYLDLFYTTKESSNRHKFDFLMTSKLFRVFQIIHSSFIIRDKDAIDPLLSLQYGDSGSSWAESTFLYWLRPDSILPKGDIRNRIWFIPSADLKKHPHLNKAPLAIIGRVDDSEIQSKNTLDIDTSPWTLHSNSEGLQECVTELSKEVNVVLFHDFPKRLKKFVRDSKLPAQILSSKPIRVDREDS